MKRIFFLFVILLLSACFTSPDNANNDSKQTSSSSSSSSEWMNDLKYITSNTFESFDMEISNGYLLNKTVKFLEAFYIEGDTMSPEDFKYIYTGKYFLVNTFFLRDVILTNNSFAIIYVHFTNDLKVWYSNSNGRVVESGDFSYTNINNCIFVYDYNKNRYKLVYRNTDPEKNNSFFDRVNFFNNFVLRHYNISEVYSLVLIVNQKSVISNYATNGLLPEQKAVTHIDISNIVKNLNLSSTPAKYKILTITTPYHQLEMFSYLKNIRFFDKFYGLGFSEFRNKILLDRQMAPTIFGVFDDYNKNGLKLFLEGESLYTPAHIEKTIPAILDFMSNVVQIANTNETIRSNLMALHKKYVFPDYIVIPDDGHLPYFEEILKIVSNDNLTQKNQDFLNNFFWNWGSTNYVVGVTGAMPIRFTFPATLKEWQYLREFYPEYYDIMSNIVELSNE